LRKLMSGTVAGCHQILESLRDQVIPFDGEHPQEISGPVKLAL